MNIFIYALFGFCLFILALALVVNLGFRPAKKTLINESVPLNAENAIKIYEQDRVTGEWFSTLVESKDSPAFLEYIDRLSGNHIEHFVVPVVYSAENQQWVKKNFLASRGIT